MYLNRQKPVISKLASFSYIKYMMRTDLTPFLNEHPSIEIVERTSGKVTLHCKDCGNTWTALPNDVLRSKYGCKNCYELSKKTTPQQWADQIHALYPDYLLKFPDEPYLWKSTKIDYCCPIHGWQNTHIGTILERGCRKCNRLKGNEKLKQTTQKTFQDEGYDEMVEILKKDDITVLTSKEDCIMYATDSTAVGTDLYLPDYILFPNLFDNFFELFLKFLYRFLKIDRRIRITFPTELL